MSYIIPCWSCILFHFYIKPQHVPDEYCRQVSCILFHFYIKPQLRSDVTNFLKVVSYSISTSNHNFEIFYKLTILLYLIPFLHQTTTLIAKQPDCQRCILFHFYIKPQPRPRVLSFSVCCILFHFYIKPQPGNAFYPGSLGCILFHFYIKPQLGGRQNPSVEVVSYSISTSNHNLSDSVITGIGVVSYSISTSNHNLSWVYVYSG